MTRQIDMTGQRFGRLVVQELLTKAGEKGPRLWLCRCDCGELRKRTTGELNAGKGLSCGCSKHDALTKDHDRDLTGKRFGYLTVLRQVKDRRSNGGRVWLCRCDCGAIREIRTGMLTSKHTKSCGCKTGEIRIGRAISEMIGRRYARLTVVRFAGVRRRKRYWLCRCDCGNVTEVDTNSLNKGGPGMGTKSCGCLMREKASETGRMTGLLNAIDITGERYGRLTAIEVSPRPKSGSRFWKCRCDCGGETEVRLTNLTSGTTRSCGCLQRELASRRGRARGRNLTGEKFGKLTVLGPTRKRFGNEGRIWLCRCDCGTEIEAVGQRLVKGMVISCGCSRVDIGRSRRAIKFLSEMERLRTTLEGRIR